MTKRQFLLISALLFIAIFVSVPKNLLFYDSPEYVGIIKNNSFLDSLGIGHAPIRPVLMAGLWVFAYLVKDIFSVSLESAANLNAYFWGFLSFIFLYLSAKEFLNNKKAYLASLLFLLFPASWIINSNFLNETLSLLLFSISTYCAVRYVKTKSKVFASLLIISLLLLFLSHVQSMFWIPAVLSIYFLPDSKSGSRNENKGFLIFLALVISSFALFIISYKAINSFYSRDAAGESIRFTKYLFGWFPDSGYYLFVLRNLRNVIISLFRGYGFFTSVLFFVMILKNRNDKGFLLGIFLLLLSFFATAWFWTGDFMLRRTIFMSTLLALYLAKYWGKVLYFLVINLLMIAFFNSLLYINAPNFAFGQIKNMHKKLSSSSKIIQTQYLDPFEKTDPRIITLEMINTDSVRNYLSEGRRVYLDSQALYSPYFLYVGNNLHITSLGSYGDSDSRYLFSEFGMKLSEVENAQKRVFAYELSQNDLGGNGDLPDEDFAIVFGKAEPSSAILFYSDRFKDRIHRERIDYADIFTWVWVIITNKHEPVSWTYADKRGNFYYPLEKREVKNICIKSEDGRSFDLSVSNVVLEDFIESCDKI